MKVLVVGSSGMLGHIVKQYLIEKGHYVICTTRNKNDKFYFDVLDNINDIETIIAEEKPQFVINCIGILNKFAEENHCKAILINSYLPHYLDELSTKYSFKFIHVSTDCVFDGIKGKYNENDLPTATSFYGRTKALGEIINDKNITFRTSIIGPDMNKNGIGLFKWFMDQTGTIHGYDKVIWSGVTTLQLAKVIEESFNTNITGLYHVVNNKTINKYDLLNMFKKYFNKEINIEKDSDFVCDKSLINTRKDFNFNIPSYEDMIKDMKKWVDNHKEMYSNL